MRARNGIAAVALLLVALVLALAQKRTSPGALAQVHAREKLASAERCEDCHAGADRSMADACSTCHADVSAAIVAGRGLHGRLDATLARDCARCHAEHQGPHAQLAGALAFERAGFASVADYRHQGLDFDLHGAHAALRCEQCHEQALADPLPADSRRFLGLSQTCTTCHEDPHRGKYGADCASCHGQEQPFKSMDGLDHDRFCPLVGAHQKLDCKTCHRDGTAWAVDVLAERHGAGEAPAHRRDCLDCHVSPHRDGFVQGVVARLAAAPAGAPGPAAPGSSCEACHSAAHESFAGRFPEMQDAWHAASGFALEKPHAGLECASCHPGLGKRTPMAATFADDAPRPVPDTRAFLADFPGRQPDDCKACHSDPHLGQFADGPFREARCLDCHARHEFAPSTVDAPAHARTAFALVGTHAKAECGDCHRLPPGAADNPEGRATRRFAGVPASCSACHASPHRDDFLRNAAQRLGLPDAAATCSQCHAPGDADFTVAHDDVMARLHAASGFALDRPHDHVACVDCHAGFTARKLDLAQTTPPARLAALATPAAGAVTVSQAAAPAFDAAFPGRLPDDCKACHQDAHHGQFDRGPFAGQGCLACHARHAFTPVAFDDEHHARTSFPLTGAHLAVGCNVCHLRPGEQRLGAPRGAVAALPDAPRQFAGTPGECAACHADVHAGRFDGPDRPADLGGERGCARCHSTAAWDDVSGARFDHGLWTGYALEGAHARAACVACHVPVRATTDGSRLFGKAAGRNCNDCHAAGSVSPTQLGGGGR